MKSDEILIKTFDQVKNDNFDQVKFDQVIVCPYCYENLKIENLKVKFRSFSNSKICDVDANLSFGSFSSFNWWILSQVF
jgi:hypothetical protein